MRVWLAVLPLAGCDRVFGIGDPYQDAAPVSGGSDAMRPDAPVDAPADAPPDVIGMPIPALLERFPFDGDLQDATHTQTASVTGSYQVSSSGGRFGGHVLLGGTACLSFTLAQQPATFSIVLWAEESAATMTYAPLLVRPQIAASTTQDWAFYADEGNFEYIMSAAGGPQTYVVSPGLSSAWYQYVVTFDGAMVHIFLDGTDLGGISGSAPAYGTGNQIYLGCDGAGGTAKFSGGLDEVEIYDGALTATQVMALTSAPPQ